MYELFKKVIMTNKLVRLYKFTNVQKHKIVTNCHETIGKT